MFSGLRMFKKKRVNLNLAQRQSSAIRLATDELSVQFHPSFNSISLKTLTWICARVFTFTETSPPPDPSRFRDAIKSLSHMLEITVHFSQG